MQVRGPAHRQSLETWALPTSALGTVNLILWYWAEVWSFRGYRSVIPAVAVDRGVFCVWASTSKYSSVVPSPVTGGCSGRGLGRGGRDAGHRGGDGQGVDGTGVHRKGRGVWAMDVPHSMLVEEVLKVADSVALVSDAGLVISRGASSVGASIC